MSKTEKNAGPNKPAHVKPVERIEEKKLPKYKDPPKTPPKQK